MLKKTNLTKDKFDNITINRLLADDFAQPKIYDLNFYKAKALNQIQSALKAIICAKNQYDFSTAITQAIAFVNAAYDYEFINLIEKSDWLIEINLATKTQLIEESS